MKYNRPRKGVTTVGLLTKVFDYLLCESLVGLEMQVKLSDDVINHVIPCEVHTIHSNRIHVKEVRRSKKCVVLYCDSISNHCSECKEAVKKQQHKDKRFEKILKPRPNLMTHC